MSTKQRQVGIEALSIVPIVVKDIDEAIEFYTETLGFELRQDEAFDLDDHSGRWVTIGVPGDDLELSLHTVDEPYYEADTQAALDARLGSQTWYTFTTRDCAGSVAALKENGVEITQEPQSYEWGTEAMFADPCGNEFSLFESAGA